MDIFPLRIETQPAVEDEVFAVIDDYPWYHRNYYRRKRLA